MISPDAAYRFIDKRSSRGHRPTIAPLFEVHVKRIVGAFAHRGTIIEIPLDFGKVVAADREAPICELEFERKAGPSTRLLR